MTATLGLGTVQFGMDYGIANDSGRPSLSQVADILRLGRATGMDLLDTAIAYGESESILGQVGVAGWKVVSKLPPIPDKQQDISGWMTAQIEDSLERLGLSRLYGVLLHDPCQMHGPRAGDIARALEEMGTQGLAARVGASIQDPSHDLPALFCHMRPTLVQAPFNFLQDELVTQGWAHKLRAMGCEIHTRSAFLQGLLLMNSESRPDHFSPWSAYWQAWERWLKETGLSPQAACLRFVCNQPEINSCVVGVDSVAQLRTLLAIETVSLPSLPKWPGPAGPELINPSRWSIS